MAEPAGNGAQVPTCQEIVELASDYLEGAMTPEQRTSFELHLNFCDGCFAFVEQVRTTSLLARSSMPDELSDETRARLLAAFRDWKRE